MVNAFDTLLKTHIITTASKEMFTHTLIPEIYNNKSFL